MKTVRNIFSASRPFLWVNTAFPFVAGWLIVNNEINWLFIVGAFFFLFPYNLAMYGINDIFDFESDIKNPRKASIEGAQLQKDELYRLWKYIFIFTIPFIAVLLWYGTALSNLILFFSLFMVVAYSAVPFRFKEIPFLDSFTSSCHFVTPLLFGIAFTNGSLTAYLPAVIAYACWGIASHSFGAIQDIEYDRQGGIASIATALGARFTLYFSALFYLLAAFVVGFTYPTTSGIIVAISLSLFAVNVLRFYQVSDTTAKDTNKGWHVFMALCMGVGALLTTGYIYTAHLFGGSLPAYAPLIISTAVFFFFVFFLRRSK